MRRYTTSDAAELLGLTAAQVRSFARAGFLAPERGPRGEYRFSFQDIVLLRAAKDLINARIHPRKVRRALHRLKAQLPRGRPLSTVRIVAEGDRVAVRDAGTLWNPESGQVYLDFSVSELATRSAPVATRMAAEARRSEQDFDSEDWYYLGLELEPVAPGEARTAYRRAIALDANNTEAHINLGRLLQEQGQLGEAESHYRKAMARAPDEPTAAFNLGTLLEDTGRTREAIDAYRRAIQVDPRCTDAHYNLARLYERTGQLDAALKHLRSFRVLTR
ncbi:MAG: tetratricopeptide repeat protein [Gammaproteobacteria bacterium]|nr:tetratricopeptide repeat protein [Gammaproteobacteria bacterium]NIR83724.1 tetratricopeptide repeat protein [Gammaproteobacteria bacterium]NIR91871.1 tetratricopeptide repeat protein [Gammaproteobacteria bacterium]NIU04890.1 tetratricopeptide repeat protein [Gammaproteobacteria bacterium]NIV51872.1 tetratricopeptide repeat protein [Gammaproteobacteria bacterium]